MKRLFLSLSIGLILLIAATSVAGCGIGSQIASTPASVTMAGGLSGNNYGGHAPIVGAKVFLLQAGTSGYGSQSTSLLTAAAGGTDTAIVGSAQNPAYYTTTDLYGSFSISGDYTCSAGLPVYIYAVGGAPNVSPLMKQTYLQSATGDGTTTTFTVDQEQMYTGQPVLISGIPAGNPFASLNGNVYPVSAISATDNRSFSILSGINATSSSFGSTAVASPQAAVNPAIANVAVLGNCPSSPPYTFGAGSSEPINFVYMNEVSTVAGMFALAPFAQTSAGVATDAQHIGIPAGNSLALIGIQNAAANAGQLYDITGATNNSDTSDGEGHVARTVAPGSAAHATAGAYVTVPNQLINTLGNILAQCVDSSNTAGIGVSGGTYSPACRILFENATSDGRLTSSTGGATNPTETATAALNIAHYPAGNGNADFTDNLANLPTGVVPFQPTLNDVPNDFIIGLNITDTSAYLGSHGGNNAKPNGIAVDANGNAFVTTTGCTVGCTLELPPTQVPASANISYTAGGTGVAVDPSGKVWVVNGSQAANGGNGPSGGFYVSSLPLGTNSFTGYGTPSSFATGIASIAIDGNGVAYVADSGETYIHQIAALGPAPAFTQYLMQGPTGSYSGQQNCETDVVGIAIDSQASGYNIWTVNNADTSSQGICAISNAATTAATTANSPVNTATVLSQLGPTYISGGVAIDANGSGWDSNADPAHLMASAFANTFGDGHFNGNDGSASGGGLSGDAGVAIDGNNNVWFANETGNSVTLFQNLGAPASASQTVGNAISPATGYTAGGTMCSPQKVAIDPSGDVWVTNVGTNCTATSGNAVTYSVTELIGVAAPTYAPLSSATLNNKLGAKP